MVRFGGRKTWIVLLLTIASYIIASIWLFILDSFVIASVATLFLYAFLHFYAIETRYLTLQEHLYVFAGLTVVWLLWGWTQGRYFILALIFFHGMIMRIVYNVVDELHNRRTISTRSLIHNGGYIFTLLITATFSLRGMATFQEFDLTCQQISTYSNEFINTMAQPLTLGYEQVNNLQNSVTSFFDTTVDDALGIPINTTKPSLNNDQGSTGIIGRRETQKDRLIDQVIEQKETVDQGICEFMITTIKEKYNTQNYIQYSVIVLLVLLLSPVVRIAVLIRSTIIWLFLRLCITLGVYKKYKVQTEVEDLF